MNYWSRLTLRVFLIFPIVYFGQWTFVHWHTGVVYFIGGMTIADLRGKLPY